MVTVTDNPVESRFEAHDGEKLVGFAAYVRTPQVVAFVHTEVDPAFEGWGVGSALAQAGIESVHAAGGRVLAICPFIAGWLARHPEYADLEYRSTSTATD